MFDRYYCIETNCDTWKFEIFEENEPVNLYLSVGPTIVAAMLER